MTSELTNLALGRMSTDPQVVKSCCARLYESDYARLLLGDSFHPGGMILTEQLGALLELKPGQRVLDVAAGVGTSAIHLARTFGCHVVGVDYGADNIKTALAAAEQAGVREQIRFEQGDAESLDFDPASFDAVICECAFCTFPDKRRAAAEFKRVLKPGGRLGLSDLTRAGQLPKDLDSLLAWIACIADAQPLASYVSLLRDSGFNEIKTAPRNEALSELLMEIRGKLLGAQLLLGIKNVSLPGIDFGQAFAMARSAEACIREDRLGYALITAKIAPAGAANASSAD